MCIKPVDLLIILVTTFLSAITNKYGDLVLNTVEYMQDKENDKHINNTDYDNQLLDHLKTFWIPERTKLKSMKLTTQENHVEAMYRIEYIMNAM